jgi:hypothetical protein
MPHQMSSPLLLTSTFLYLAPLSPDTGLSRGGVIKVHHSLCFNTTDPYHLSSHTRGGVTKPHHKVVNVAPSPRPCSASLPFVRSRTVAPCPVPQVIVLRVSCIPLALKDPQPLLPTGGTFQRDLRSLMCLSAFLCALTSCSSSRMHALCAAMTTSPPVAQNTPRSECGRLSLSFVSIFLLFLDSILLGGESPYSIYVQLAAPFSADLNYHHSISWGKCKCGPTLTNLKRSAKVQGIRSCQGVAQNSYFL